jgi:hypothetical protein
MANIIRIKRRSAAGAVGAPASLASAELAYNEADDVLYIGYGDDGFGTATSVRSLAGPGSYVTLSSAQTIGGAKAFATTPTVTDTLLTTDNSSKVATTAFVKAQNYLTANQTITVTGDVSGSGTTALTLTLANTGVGAGTYTKVTVDAKGRVTSATTLTAADIPTLTAAKISDFNTVVRTNRLDQMAVPTADISFNGFKLTNLAAPVNAGDAATKAYVDASRSGLDVKDSVRAASTGNVTATYSATGGVSARGQFTAAPNILDGVTLAAGNRILLKNQSTAAQNGIWVVSTVGTGSNGIWDRATDFDGDAEVTAGAFMFVTEGTANGDSGWVLTTNDPIVIGGASGTALTFAQFSGAGQVEAGAGLTKSGNTIDVVGTTNRITVNADSIDIASTYAGQATITTLGTISAGAWQATVVGLQYGGTGTNLSGAADGSIFKKSGTGLVVATAGTDYLNSNSTIVGGTF